MLLRDMSRYRRDLVHRQEYMSYLIELFKRRRLLFAIRDCIQNGEMPRHAPLLTRMSEMIRKDNAQIPDAGDGSWLTEV